MAGDEGPRETLRCAVTDGEEDAPGRIRFIREDLARGEPVSEEAASEKRFLEGVVLEKRSRKL